MVSWFFFLESMNYQFHVVYDERVVLTEYKHRQKKKKRPSYIKLIKLMKF